MKLVSPNTEAILLLTAPLLIGKSIETTKPLLPKEYRELAAALLEMGRQPADLLQDSELLGLIAHGTVAERVKQLLNRGLQLTHALELWNQRGIRVISRADREYPRRFKERLRENAPPLLYCCGNIDLFNRGGLAVVGSRKVDDHFELVEYADKVGAACAKEHVAIISGGAKGADKISMLGCLKNGGVSVGILSCRMNQDVVSRDYKPYLRKERLLLCSVADPSAGWNTGLAMQRNKYIYALADHGLVVASETKGGTWEGATEQLGKLEFCPLMVNVKVLPASGNKKLVEKGALPFRLDFSKPIIPQLENAAASGAKKEQIDLFDMRSPGAPAPVQPEPQLKVGEDAAGSVYTVPSPAGRIERAVFPLLLDCLREPMEPAQLQELTEIKKGQLNVWLKKMCEQGWVKKLSKPVRYVAENRQFP